MDATWVKKDFSQDIFISEANVMTAKSFGWKGQDSSKSRDVKSEGFATYHGGDGNSIPIKDKICEELTYEVGIEMKSIRRV